MMPATTTLLSDLCDFVGVQVDPSSRADDVYYGLEHVTPGRFVANGEGKASDVQSSKYAFQSGDVLYGKLRPYLDKAILADRPGICTTELLVLRPKAGVDPRFLVGIVHAPNFIEHAVAGTTGVQHPRTSWNHVCGFELPAFEPEEQSNIANLLWQVHDNLTANEAAIEAGIDLKRAAMRALFTKGLRDEAQKDTEIGLVPESWDAVPISGLGNVVTGNTPPTKDSLNYDGGHIPFVAPGDIEHGCSITKTAKNITEGGLATVRPIPAGTTCFVCIGSTIGKVGFTSESISATNQQINSILPSPDFEPQYVFYLMTYWADHIRKQSAPSPVPILSKGVFEQIVVLTSKDKAEQREIVAVLDAIDRKIDLHKRKRAVLEELFKSLLHKLMTGEIRVADLDLSALETDEESIGANGASPKRAAGEAA